MPSAGDLPNPAIKPGSPALKVDSLPAELPEKPMWYDQCHMKTTERSPKYQKSMEKLPQGTTWNGVTVWFSSSFFIIELDTQINNCTVRNLMTPTVSCSLANITCRKQKKNLQTTEISVIKDSDNKTLCARHWMLYMYYLTLPWF